MRRTLIIAAILLCLPTILFFTCFRDTGGSPGRQQTADEHPALQQMSNQFNATADINYKGFAATAQITQSSPQSCQVVFSAPESVKDMAFEFGQDSVTVHYKGLSFEFDPSAIPLEAVAKMAVATINTSLHKDGLDVGYTDGALTVSGEGEHGNFTLDLDPDTGNLLKLSVPDHQFEIAFSSFEFLR